MVGLRLREGVELTRIANLLQETGGTSTSTNVTSTSSISTSTSGTNDIMQRCLETLKPYEEEGLVAVEGGGRVRLLDPEGFLVSNDVIASLFAALGGGED